jgi:hypothetical protein
MLGGWKLARHEVDLPDLLFLLDASKSMTLPSDQPESRSVRNRWESTTDLLSGDDGRWLRDLAEQYRLRFTIVGDQTVAIPGSIDSLAETLATIAPDGEQSRLGTALVRAAEGQRGRSTAAIVLISDGINTDGTTLAEAAGPIASQRLPVFAVRTGNIEPPPAVELSELVAERTAMIGDQVRVMARLRWRGTDGRSITLRMTDSDDGRLLAEQTVTTTADQGTTAALLMFTAEQAGLRRLRVSADPLPEELTTADNVAETTVEVRDESFRVLLVQGGPSYEFRFLKHLLERATSRDGSRPLVELTSVLQRGDPRYADQDRAARRLPPVDDATLNALDLVILSDCDPAGLGNVLQARIADLVISNGTSLVVIAGPNYLPQKLAGTPLEKLLPVEPDRVANPGLSQVPLMWRKTPLGRGLPSLQIAAGDRDWEAAPPVYWLARADRVRPGARILLETAVGVSEDATVPIVISQQAGSGQVWLQLTDESFRLHAAGRGGELYESYWLQLVRALARRSVTDDQQRPRLTIRGDRFSSRTAIPFSVRLPAKLAATVAGEVEIAVSDSEGQSRNYRGRIDAEGRAFSGLIEGLEPGSYRAILTRPLDEGDPASDAFVVQQDAQELQTTTVDLQALESLAATTGGKVIDISNARSSLPSMLPEGRTVKVRALTPIVIWNHWSVCGLLFGLLAIQWILRRWFGSV